MQGHIHLKLIRILSPLELAIVHDRTKLSWRGGHNCPISPAGSCVTPYLVGCRFSLFGIFDWILPRWADKSIASGHVCSFLKDSKLNHLGLHLFAGEIPSQLLLCVPFQERSSISSDTTWNVFRIIISLKDTIVALP